MKQEKRSKSTKTLEIKEGDMIENFKHKQIRETIKKRLQEELSIFSRLVVIGEKLYPVLKSVDITPDEWDDLLVRHDKEVNFNRIFNVLRGIAHYPTKFLDVLHLLRLIKRVHLSDSHSELLFIDQAPTFTALAHSKFKFCCVMGESINRSYFISFGLIWKKKTLLRVEARYRLGCELDKEIGKSLGKRLNNRPLYEVTKDEIQELLNTARLALLL